MKAAIIARESDKKQDSNDAQVMRIEDYIKAKGLKQWKTFPIEDESSTRGKREKMHAAIKEIVTEATRTKECIAIVFDTVDRLMRSFKDMIWADELRKSGDVELHFYRENLVIHKNSNSADIIRWEMAVLMAHAYVLQLSDNVKRKFEHNRRNGEWMGHPRIGYIRVQETNEKGEVIWRDIVPDSEKAHLLVRIFEMYATGTESITSIWEKITEEGLRGINGQKLSRSNIELILKDKFYYGIACSKKHGEYPHKYKPLITKELFDKCQAVREHRGKAPAQEGARQAYIFKGLLRCQNCNCLMTPEIKKGRFVYYSCTNAKGICKRTYVPEKLLLKPIHDVFESFKNIPQEVHDRLVTELRSINEQEAVFHDREVSRIRTEYDRTQTRVKNLLDMRLDGSITQGDYDSKLQELKDKQYVLNIELEEHTKADHQYHLHVSQVVNLSQRMGAIFESSDLVEKRAILNFLLQNPVVNGKTLGFTLRSPFNLVLQLATYPSQLPELDGFRTAEWRKALQEIGLIPILSRLVAV